MCEEIPEFFFLRPGVGDDRSKIVSHDPVACSTELSGSGSTKHTCRRTGRTPSRTSVPLTPPKLLCSHLARAHPAWNPVHYRCRRD